MDNPSENLTMIEHDSVESKNASFSVNLNLPPSDSSDSRSSQESSSSGEEESESQVQQKWKFSIVLMKTILETLHGVIRAKLRIAKAKYFYKWRKMPKIDHKPLIALKIRSKVQILLNVFNSYWKRRISSAFIKLEEQNLVYKISEDIEIKSKETEKKFKQRLKEVSEAANKIYHKQEKLEKKSNACFQQENLYKKTIKSLNAEYLREREIISKIDSDKQSYSILTALEVENQQLKSDLEDIESRVVSFFDDLSGMIDSHQARVWVKSNKTGSVKL
ncbi:unnamed protein product [Blepharisma stoltei]|uniref:Uncharacterized protein n=1 Tax=Blepharisma stoltei TaxID=1481888 RepID=A0AAU9JAA7_9CILI|nr:unnamed protein product [Blepharisma stoltei]